MAAKKDAKIEMPTFEMPKFEMPSFDMPKMEVPAAVRDAAEKSIAQAKDTYEKMKAAAEETTDLFEESYATYAKGCMELTTKALEAAKANTAAAFDFAKDILGAKMVAEFVEKHTAFARAQTEAMMAQAKEFQTLGQAIANDTAAPYKAAAEKAVAQFKKSA
jgi:phasin